MSNIIRFAEPKDIEQISNLVQEWSEQYGLDYVESDINNSLSDIVHNHIAIVIEENNLIKGCLLGAIAPALFNYNINQFQEIMLYVLPKYRKEGIGAELMKGLDRVAKDKDIKQLSMVAPNHIKADKLDKFYTRLGYHKYEIVYKKEI